MGGFEAPLRPSVAEEEPRVPAPSCGAEAGLYGSGGLKLWVTRRGTIEQENPLRPLSRETLLVLQVAVNGRLATAYGPDADHLRQGSAPARLEEASGHPVRWAPDGAELPASLRIVAEDGTVLLGPLAFQSCGPAPRAVPQAAAKPVPPPKGRPNPPAASAPASGAPPGLSLPQGAIGGMTLPTTRSR